MIEGVIDDSAYIEAMVGKKPDLSLRWWTVHRRLGAPELLDIEAAHVLRGLALGGRIPVGEAQAMIEELLIAPIERVSHQPLIPRVWELRANATAYDAAYIALAELYEVPLLTCDTKMQGVSGHDATIICFERS
jgi:predicted nucleic acid-binding protein